RTHAAAIDRPSSPSPLLPILLGPQWIRRRPSTRASSRHRRRASSPSSRTTPSYRHTTTRSSTAALTMVLLLGPRFGGSGGGLSVPSMRRAPAAAIRRYGLFPLPPDHGTTHLFQTSALPLPTLYCDARRRRMVDAGVYCSGFTDATSFRFIRGLVFRGSDPSCTCARSIRMHWNQQDRKPGGTALRQALDGRGGCGGGGPIPVWNRGTGRIYARLISALQRDLDDWLRPQEMVPFELGLELSCALNLFLSGYSIGEPSKTHV
ncbi:unnamed protein product, partial [Urochloa humidicola]